MTVVTTHYRYKRPPRTRKVVALEVPGIVRTKQPRGTLGAQPETVGTQPIRTIARGNATLIVTVRKTGKRFADVPDLTPEEHQRRGDAADAMWRELVWRVAGKDRSD